MPTLPIDEQAIQNALALRRLPAPTPSAIAMPSQLPSLGPIATPAVTRLPSAVDGMQESVLRNQNDLKRLQTQGSVYQRITHPTDPSTGQATTDQPSLLRKIGGGLLQGLDTAYSTLAPGPASLTSGTTANQHLRMRQDQQNIQAGLQGEDESAQASQRDALAQQEQAKAQALTHPKPTDGQLVFDGEKNPIGFHDGQGNFYGPHDANLPHGIADILAQAHAKQPTNEFELWHQQNPQAPASDFFSMKAANAPEKAGNKDDKAIAIYAKPANQRSPAEVSYLNGYEEYTKKTKVDPGVARMQVMMQMPQAMVDPTDPTHTRIIYGTRSSVNGQEAPQSGDARAASRLLTAFTSGPESKTLTAINTADAHVQQFGQIAKALQNNNVQIANKIGNAFGVQFGASAPVNFQLLKTALAGEIGKTLTGSVATVEETKEISKAINDANSPEQLAGVADTASHLMHSKRQVLFDQFQQGQQGNPNFGNTGTSSAAQSRGVVSLASAKQLADNKGKTDDQIRQHIVSLGYTVGP